MKVEYREAVQNNADVLTSVYNAAFYNDYIRYGEHKKGNAIYGTLYRRFNK